MSIRSLTLLLPALLCLALSRASWAQPQQEKVVLLFPVALRGDYRPVSGQDFTTVLNEQVKLLAPSARLIIPRAADIQGLGYASQDQPPTQDQTRRLCAAYGANRAAWLSIRFSPELNQDGPQGVMTLAAAARLWAFNAETGKVGIDEPVSLARTSLVDSKAGPDDLKKTEATLNNQVVQDLAQQLITLAQQRAAQQRSRVWSNQAQPGQATQPGPGLSAQARSMIDAIKSYSSAVDQGDLISATDSQRRAMACWYKLDQGQQRAVEQQYPGTEQWMKGGAYYNYGYPYYR